MMEQRNEANFLWPLQMNPKPKSLLEFCGCTLIMYWWSAILVAAVFARSHRKWRAALYVPIPFLSCWVATLTGLELASLLKV
jgi:hypothetical protein